MIKRIITLVAVAFLLNACTSDEPSALYKYEQNPAYSYGYAEFFGDWYADYNNPNNIISLTLLTPSLQIDTDGKLSGTGQLLYIEDIFVPNTFNYLADGTYTASESQNAYTFLPGKKFDADGFLIDTGAYLMFYEKNTKFTIKKLVSKGSFTVKTIDSIHKIDFDLTLSDSSKVKGSFNNTLPYFDSSIPNTTKALRKPQKLHQTKLKLQGTRVRP